MRCTIPTFRIAVALFAAAAVVGTAAEASALEAPVRTTLVNGGGDSGAATAETMRKILRDHDKIAYVPESQLLAAGESTGVNVETLRDGDQRATHQAEFRKTMESADVEMILVLDVFSGTSQLVGIGPFGKERSDRRRRIAGGRLSRDAAAKQLQATIAQIKPALEKSRRSTGTEPFDSGASDPKSPSANTSEAGGNGERSSRESTDSAGRNSHTSAAAQTDVGSGHARIEPGVEFRLGPLLGRRQLQVEDRSSSSKTAYSVNSMSPLVGGRVGVRTIFGRFSGGSAGFGLDLFATVAPSRTKSGRTADGSPGTEKLSSLLSHAGFDLQYLKDLGGGFRFDFATGFEVLSFRLEKNPWYTGNRYAQFRFTTGLDYLLFRNTRLHVGGGAAPILESDMSGGAFGDNAFAPALLADGALKFGITDSTAVSLDYDFYFYDLVYRSPQILDRSIDVSDSYHLGTIQFRYGF